MENGLIALMNDNSKVENFKKGKIIDIKDYKVVINEKKTLIIFEKK